MFMQHDAITKDSQVFCSNPTPAGINAYKKAYRDALAEQGMTRELAAEFKRKTKHCGQNFTQKNCDNTAIFDRIIEGLNLDNLTISSDGEVINHSQARRQERDSIMADMALRRLGIHGELERTTDKNALELQAMNIKNELADIRQTFDFSKSQSELQATQRKYRALELRLKSLEVEMMSGS